MSPTRDLTVSPSERTNAVQLMSVLLIFSCQSTLMQVGEHDMKIMFIRELDHQQSHMKITYTQKY